MDGGDVSAGEMAACLADLAAVNTVTLARLPTVAFMRRVVRRAPGRTLRVLDVACGEGDMLRRLHRWAGRAKQRMELVGLDLNPLCIAAARAATPADVPIEYRTGDVFGTAPGQFDVVLSSLFTHHLADDEVVAFLALMERTAAVGWFVNDLQRHAIAFHGFRALAAVAGWHRFVVHDGPVSVARSFRGEDWRRLLSRAGLERVAQVRHHVPFRCCVSRLK